MELTREQQKAIAMAKARQRAALVQKRDSLDASLQNSTLAGAAGGALSDIDDNMRLAANGISLGFLDKALGQEDRARTDAARGRQGYTGMLAETAGSMAVPGMLASKGVTAARIPGLFGKAAGMGIDGAAIGAVQAAGNDKNIGQNALIGALLGAGGQAAMNIGAGIARPIISRIAPQRASDRVMANAMESAKMTPATIADDLSRARGDGQDVYAVMDALGHPGQRLASTVVRTPNEGRTPMVNFLETRQAGQGQRIASALADAFEAPKTAAQQTKALEASRRSAADVDYGAARAAAKDVSVMPAVQEIKAILGTPKPKPEGLAPDSIEASLATIYKRLFKEAPLPKPAQPKTNTALKSVKNTAFFSPPPPSPPAAPKLVSGFDQVLRIKQDVDDMIDAAFRGGHNNKARLLSKVRDKLDDALEGASEPYAQARDKFRQASRVIDAVEEGTTTAQRGRYQNTVPAFGKMTPEQQAAYRVGYAEPLIGKAEQSAFGVNKARPLINDKYSKEFPAIAAPGKADQLGARIRREQTMFETRGAASGGSKTADNLADEAGLSAIDPSIIGNMLTGNWTGAARNALLQGVSSLKGQPASVRERISKALMETDPVLARAKLTNAIEKLDSTRAKKDLLLRAIMSGGVSGAIEYQR